MATQTMPSSKWASEVMSSAPAWKELLEATKVEDILQKGRPLVKAQYFEEVSSLLKRMSESKVLSAVVIDSDPKIGVVGFVDVLDLLVYVLDVADQNAKDITVESVENIKWEGQCFERQNIGTIINRSQTDPLYTISAKASLMEAVKLFAREIHRLAVVDDTTPEHHIANIISQSDIVSLLASRGVYLGSKMEKSIVHAGITPLGVCTVLDDVNVVAALRYMRDYRVNGVGVVDKAGRLISNFSASDLLGLTADNFGLLVLSVKEYLTRIHGFSKPPVYCTQSDSVELLLLKFAMHKVHRVYIVDKQMMPIGVITLTDIMQFLLVE